LAQITAGAIVLVLWGWSLSHAKPLGGLDFRALYEGAACLIHHHDPFSPAEVRAYYIATGDARLYPEWALYTLTLLNYLPTIYPFTAPLAQLPWATAQALWTALTAISLLVAAALMWRRAEKDAPLVAGCLIGFLLANSEIILSGGNAAGFAVGLCAIAAWCWIEERWEWLGVLCLASSLAMKPHDGGLVWFYFLLAGGRYRTRAAQTLAVDVALGIGSVLWVWQVAPHWYAELRQLMAIYSAHGGANDPGIMGSPKSAFRNFSMAVFPGMVCNLQSLAGVFRDDPRFYNSFTYLFCAPFLAVWAFATHRAEGSKAAAYLALAAIVPFTLLITYHRTTDTKLLILTVPACALLWARGGAMGKLGLVLTSVGIFITGDIPLVVIGRAVGQPDWSHAGWLGKIPLVFVYRPVPVVLLAMGSFYLWAYVKGRGVKVDTSESPAAVLGARAEG
jgi:multidrug transporter EmrE-like cation transporter